MLVLSRRQNDKIVFPHLGITVHVVRISGNTVRVGVDAPSDVKVLRHELAASERDGAANPEPGRKTLTHELRNRLNTAKIALHLMRKQLEAGMISQAEGTLEMALREFEQLNQRVAAAKTAPAQKGSNRRRALLVEDDANERELLAGFLRISGFDVDTAGDGQQALEYLSVHQRPDVVLLDMLMPRCDGPTTLGAIRKNPLFAGLKVVAVSGTEPGIFGVPDGPEGCDRWFAKPVDPEKLVKELEREVVCRN